MGRKILEKKICRHMFDTVGQLKVTIQDVLERKHIFPMCKIFVIFNLKIRKFDNKQMQGYT